MSVIMNLIKRIIEVIKEPVLALFLVIWIINFLVGNTRVASESMMPTINPGDHLFINRLPYYYRNPIRGEIIVFKHEDNYLIKRVIGVGGDKVDIIDNKIYINDSKLDETRYLTPHMNTYKYSASQIEFPYIIPEDCYFVLGDNRVDSKDSRVFGAIIREDIIAKANIRFLPMNKIGEIN